MAFTHSICLSPAHIPFVCQTLSGSLPHLTFCSPSWIKDEWCFFCHFLLFFFSTAYGSVCVFCVCVMSPAWPCLSEAEPCCQCACVCLRACVCKPKDEEMKLWSILLLSFTLSSQNEMLNTSQSVKWAFKIETDLLFHYYTTKLIVLTTCCIRYDKWLQRWKQAARADDSPSVRCRRLNSDCQLFICIRWRGILLSSTASGFCLVDVGDSDLTVTCPPHTWPVRWTSGAPWLVIHFWWPLQRPEASGTSNLNMASMLWSYQQ